MNSRPNKTLIRLITAVTLLVSLLGPLVTSPQTAFAANVGTLTIRKVTSPSPDSTNQSFGFTVTKGGSTVSNGSFSLQNGGTRNFALDNSRQNNSRTYVITESAVTGWALTNVTCTGGDGDWNITTSLNDRTASIRLSSSNNDRGDVTCTFTNTKDAAPVQPGLSPLVVNETLQPGTSTDIAKLVTPPDSPPGKLDVLFLVDTTGSMANTIANVQANATNIMNTVQGQIPDSQFAVAAYRDDYDSQNPPNNYYYWVAQSMSGNVSTVQANGINRLAARALGSDVPEGQINALYQVATGGPTSAQAVGFRTGSDVTRVIVWFGDATGHDPSPRTNQTQGQGANLTYWGGQHNEAQVIAALQAAGIKVISINVSGNSQYQDDLDGTGQATRISNATGGAYLGSATSSTISDKILEGLTNLPVQVKLVVDTANCQAPPLSITFSPASVTVQGGQTASFTETVAVAPGTPGGTYTCRVYGTADGQPIKDGNGNIIYETITINVPAQEGTIKIVKDAVPNSAQSFAFTGDLGTFNLVDNGTDPNFQTFTKTEGTYAVTESGVNGWDLSGVVCEDPTSDSTINGQTATIKLKAGETVTCTFTNTQRQDLTVSKTANGSYNRTYTWDINKSIDETSSSVTISPDGTATFNYNVLAKQTGFIDSAWTLTGTITVSNPNSFDVTGVTITDTFAGGGTCTVTNGTNVTVPANGSVSRDYSCTITSLPNYDANNTATASWNSSFHLPNTSATGSSAVTWTLGQELNKTVTVKDDKTNPSSPVELGTVTANPTSPWVDQTFEYSLSFEGVDAACTDYTNNAWLEVGGTPIDSDSQKVTVCVSAGPDVSKTVDASYTTTYSWTINKDVDKTRAEIASGTATFNYTVDVTNTAVASLWKVTGTISVTNNDFNPMTNVVVTDDILDDSGDSCTVAAGATTIAAGATETYDYTCTWTAAPAATSQTNQATVTWGTDGSATYDAAVEWSDATVTKVDETITVSDSLGGELGTATAGTDANPTKQFTYAKSFSGVTGACTTYNNQATFTSTDSHATNSASKSVEVCVGANLTGTKTASGSFGREYLWSIDKTVDDAQKETSTGAATFNYSVTVTQTGVTDSGYSVSGTITVNNPNIWQTVTVDITDAIGTGWTCAVTDGTGVVVPKATDASTPGTASVNYTCTWTGTGSPSYTGTNTATITWDAAAAHTTSGSVTATKDFTLTSTGGTNRTINVSDPLAPTGTFTSVTATDPPADPTTKVFTYAYEFTGNAAGTCTTHDNTATITETGQFDTQQVKVCVGADLTVSKSAVPAYHRTVTWDIDKNADQTDFVIATGGTAAVEYTIDVTKTVTQSAWVVNGSITATNPNDWQAVTVDFSDAIDSGGSCTVTDGNGVVVPASGTAMRSYQCTFTSNPGSGTNTGTVSWNSATAHTPTGTASGAANYDFATASTTTDGYDNITVGDPAAVPSTKAFTDSGQWVYTVNYTGDPAGECTTHDNTATITQTNQTANESVEVCVTAAPTVSKTANPAYTTTYTWDIKKNVDATRLEIASGNMATFNYTVDVTHDNGTPSAWKVTGTISVTNNNFEAMTNVAVADAIDSDANVSCVVDAGATTIAVGASADYTYTCTWTAAPAATIQTNQATVTWGTNGTATTTQAVNWTNNSNVTLVDETINVSDSLEGALGTATVGTDPNPKQFAYSQSFAGVTGACTDYNNQATFTTTDNSEPGSASKTVSVCVGANLTGTKTAAGSYDRTYLWSIDKTVADDTIETSTGAATFDYTVTVTQTGVSDSGYGVSGTITVSNPNIWQAVTVDITDAIGTGWTCDVTNGEDVVVPAATNAATPGTATVSYDCSWTGTGSPSYSGTNTATITWDKDAAHTSAGSATATAPFTLTNTGGVNKTINVSDPLAPSGTFTAVTATDPPAAPTTEVFTYAYEFTGNPAGTCTTHDNTATIVETNQSDTQQVSVCVGADMTVSKTASPAYHRTVTWAIDKNADATRAEIADDESATFQYTVDVTKTVIQSGWVVNGTITVTNPNDWQDITVDITDVSDNGGNCIVTDGDDVIVPASSSVSRTYQCTFTSNMGSGTNLGTATWNSATAHTPTGTASGGASYDFATAATTTTGYDNITVSDPAASPTSKAFSDSGEWVYTVSYDGVAGTCTTYDNTATITQTSQTASESVDVCVGAELSGSKTATATFDRTYLWDIQKSVDTESQNVPAGTDATFNYSVVASQTGVADSGYTVSGTITVSNPNDWQSVAVNVADAIGAGWSCTFPNGSTGTVPAASNGNPGTLDIDYTCTWTGTGAPTLTGTNSATITWDAEDASTASGTTTATAGYTLAIDGTTNKTVTVVDDKTDPENPVTLGQLVGSDTSTMTTQTWTYAIDLAGVAGVCTDYTNTAAIKVGDAEIDSAGKTVAVCGAVDLGVSKTATTAFVRTYTWDITKDVAPTSLDLFAGESADPTYTVSVDKTTTDSAWVVSGTITVTNPNQFASVVVDISDSINNGGVCLVANGTDVTVPAATAAGAGVKTFTYTCTYQAAPAPYSGTNTATATWDAQTLGSATGSASGIATADFSTAAITEVGDNEVNVDDTNGESWGPVSDDDTWTYTDALVCSSDPADYVNGHYTYTHQNTAEIVETGDSDTASVAVDCYAPVVSSAGVADYTRTWDWDVTKTADATTLTLPFWQSGSINYQVTVTGSPVDSDLTINGTLTVNNPNPNAAMTVQLAGDVNGAAASFTSGGTCTISNGSVTVPAGGTATCTFTAPLGDDFPQAGTAAVSTTVTIGGVPFANTLNVTIGDPSSILDDQITVNDSLVGNLGTVSAGAEASTASKTFNYPLTVGPYPAGTHQVIDNVASYVTNDTGTEGSDDWTVDVRVPIQTICDCTQDLSYWVNMADKGGRRGYDATWELVGPQAANTKFFQSPYSFRTVLVMLPRGNDVTYYGLAQSYIVAELNLLHGASAPQQVVDAMYAAKALFETYTPAQVASMNSSQKAQFTALTTTLSRFNNGYIGPGRCR